MLGIYLGAARRHLSGCSRRCRAASCPAQDKQYLVGFAQLPDGATLDRTEEVIRRMSDIALEAAGRRARGRLPGPVDQRLHQQLQRRHRVRDAEAVRRAQDARSSAAPPSRMQLNQKYRRHPGRLHRHVPAAAGARARHDRRLQAADRGSRRPRLRGARRGDQGVPGARPTRRPSSPACSPATRSTCRSSTPTSTAPRRASSACR